MELPNITKLRMQSERCGRSYDIPDSHHEAIAECGRIHLIWDTLAFITTDAV